MTDCARRWSIVGFAAGAGAGTYAFGDVRVDFRQAQVFRDGAPVPLSALEFKLLGFFIQNRGALLTRDEMAEAGETDSDGKN